MDKAEYRVLFQGRARDDETLSQLRIAMRRTFDLDLGALERLFCGAPVVIKPSTSQATAERFKQTIGQMGGICWYEPLSQPHAPYVDRRVGPRRLQADRRRHERAHAIQPDRRQLAGRRWDD